MTVDVDQGTIPQWTVSDRLRKAREYAGMEQAELAARVGIARNTVSNYERGATPPKRPVLLSWALACGVPLGWLQTGVAPSGDPSSDARKSAGTHFAQIGRLHPETMPEGLRAA